MQDFVTVLAVGLLLIVLVYLVIGRITKLTRQVQALTVRVYQLEIERREAHTPEPASEPVLPKVSDAPPPLPAVAKPPEPRDWEATIGGNWLNKLGVLILVIGIALFLGYSLTELGPTGKVIIGFAVGASMLVGGLTAERKPEYRTFAWGLIGGGWAAIYFTTYAMHGVDAAKLISDPVIATALLLGVSLAIILHSFAYQSEVVTGIAFFVAFVSLNVSLLNGFTVVATLILAVSLIVIAHRFEWHQLAIAGAIFTYATFGLRYEPSVYGLSGILNGQSVLWIYWLLFETFDLISLGKKTDYWLFGLNAAGFLASSVFHEWSMRTSEWALFFSVAALAYLVSTLVRVYLKENYYGAATLSAALCVVAIIEKFTGLQIPIALMVEAEVIVIAGLLLRQQFLLRLGGALFLPAVIHLLAVDVMAMHKANLLGREMNSWTPVAVAMALVFCVNRVLTQSGPVYTFVASALITLVVHEELPPRWVAVAWALMAIGALAIGVLRDRRELRRQAYILAFLTFWQALFVSLNAPFADARILTVAIVIAAFYGSEMLLRGRRPAAGIYSIAGTILLTALIYNEVHGRLLTVALGIEAAVLLACGFVLLERVLRLSGLILFLVCIAKLFAYDLRELDTMGRILSFIILGLMLLGASWIYTRFREQIRRLL